MRLPSTSRGCADDTTNSVSGLSAKSARSCFIGSVY